MIINIKLGTKVVQVEGDVFVDSESMDIIVTDPCVDGETELSYSDASSDLEEVGRLLHENLTDEEIANCTGLNASRISEIRKCTKPEYNDLKLVSYGWPEMSVIMAVRKMENK